MKNGWYVGKHMRMKYDVFSFVHPFETYINEIRGFCSDIPVDVI